MKDKITHMYITLKNIRNSPRLILKVKNFFQSFNYPFFFYVNYNQPTPQKIYWCRYGHPFYYKTRKKVS